VNRLKGCWTQNGRTQPRQLPEQIKRYAAETPVIPTVVSDTKENTVGARKSDVYDYSVKPFSFELGGVGQVVEKLTGATSSASSAQLLSTG